MQPRLSIVTLGVKDLERSARFYEAVGFEVRRGTSNAVLFQTIGPILALASWEALAEDAHLSPAGDGFRGQRLVSHFHSMVQVREAYDEWIAAGGYSVRPPADRDWGAYTAIVADPDAHLWEFVHNPDQELVRFNMFGQLELS
ncbi:VOC family protein [Raineyella fluvialis]|uniref:VOC family protein n=1 Tax=Raineyella fluvialis TaxID=2662261 RepID=A0A5Q2FBF9_9ACTN|nr:VOC family protein [Raineyella fluvialis]QGF23741.1 VOC family protein [Raineyella fluvialis]